VPKGSPFETHQQKSQRYAQINFKAKEQSRDHEGGFFVSFPVPEALTQGETYEDALAMAADALATALEFYTDDNRPVPLPSQAKPGQPVIAPAKL